MHLKGADVSEAFPAFSLETSVLKFLIEALEYNGNKVAQIEVATGRSYTFADILQYSKSIAAGLSSAGIQPGDYVVICCGKSSLAYSAQLGVMFTGAIAVVIDVNHANDIHKFTKNQVVRAVFCDKKHLHAVNESVSNMSPEPTLIATTDFDDTTMKLLLLPSDEFSLFEVKEIRKTVVLVLYTSGTTADVKGVEISDLGLQRLGYSFVDESIESYLLTSPNAWISSTISLVSSIFKGYFLVLSEVKDAAVNLKLIEKYSINGWTAFGGSINLYVEELSRATIDLSSLTVLNVGGTVVKGRTIERIVSDILKGKTGPQVIYGMTETGLITSWRNRDLLDLSKADSSGYLAPGVEVKVTDEQGHLAEAGNIGVVWVKSLSLMVGYWGRHELNQEVFDSDGFFRTGDAGYFDNDGFLYISGRASEIITHKGTKVSVSEIEDLLKSHPELLDAGVVSKPHPTEGHNLFAFIVVKPGRHVRKEDISLFFAEQTGETMKLKEIQMVEAIPKTYTGKVHKGMLHNMVDKLLAKFH